MMEVTVDSLGGLGDGMAESCGKPVFIAKSCPGDRLEIKIVHENRDGMQGVITRILSPGPERRDAPCRHYSACGGCTLQHFIPESYRRFKERMLRSALDRAGFPDAKAEVLYVPERSRRRVEFKVRHDGGLAMAFHDLRSHNPTAIEECLLLVPELEALIAPLNEALASHDFSPHLYAVSLTSADSGIDMMLTFRHYDTRKLPPLEALARKLGVARICARTPDSQVIVAVNIAPVEMTLGDYPVALPPEAFLQAARQGQAELTRIAMDAVQGHTSVVDLFCGIGSYSFPASRFASVHAVELDAAMVQAIRHAARRHGIQNLTGEVRDLFKNPVTAQELARFSAAIINPPRAGAKAQTQALAESKIHTVAMISCNPATFARDAAILKGAGFTLACVSAMDQFLWSQHLEIAAVLRR